MAQSEVDVPVADVPLTIRVRISGVRMWTARMRLGAWLMNLAAIVLPADATVEVQIGGEDGSPH